MRHIVLFTLQEGISVDDQGVLEAARLSEEHPRHISEIREWWCGFDVSGRDIAADFMVMGVFDSTDALDRYMAHAHHRQGVRAWREVAEWKVIDVDEDVARTTRRRGAGE